MKILHFASENYARIPSTLVKAERKLGHESILVTLYHTFQKYAEEDYCLELPLVSNKFIAPIKRMLNVDTGKLNGQRRIDSASPPIWSAPNIFSHWLFYFRDRLWKGKIWHFLNKININSFNVLILDGGAGFLRSGEIVQELKQRGLKIVVYYCGSDLRTRGIIRAVDSLADYRFTFEYDHTLLDSSLPFLFAPFHLPQSTNASYPKSDKIRIGHAPTKRIIKGTDIILDRLNNLKQKYPIEIVLIENQPYTKALILKKSCDIFIDSIGEIGYGINSLESLTMGIPTAVEILSDLESLLGEHPLINICATNIEEKIIPFIESSKLRIQVGKKSKIWVEQMHNSINIARTILNNLN